MKTALIVIDVQESFRHRPYFSTNDLAPYFAAQNLLIERFQQHGAPIVRVFHIDPSAPSDNPFQRESGHVKPLEGLTEFDASHTIYKTRHSCLVGTGLEDWIKREDIGELVISGIRTEQCCETTARHASDLGYRVVFPLDATLTFDMQHLDGSTLKTADIKARTAAVLSERFAKICGAVDVFSST